jgi:hypothetical protein
MGRMAERREDKIYVQQGKVVRTPHNRGYSLRPLGPWGHRGFGFGTYSISLIAGET